MTTKLAQKSKSSMWAGIGMMGCFLAATALLASGLASESASPIGKPAAVAIR